MDVVVPQDVAITVERRLVVILADVVRLRQIIVVGRAVVTIVDGNVVRVTVDELVGRHRAIVCLDCAIDRVDALASNDQVSRRNAGAISNRHTIIFTKGLAIQGVVLQVKAICTVNIVERNYRIVDILANVFRDTTFGLAGQSAGANNPKIKFSVTIDILELRRAKAATRTIFCRIRCIQDICVRKRIRINLNPVFLGIVHLVIPKDIRGTLQILMEPICVCIIGARIIILIRTTIVTIVDIDIVYITIDQAAPGREAMFGIVCDDRAISRFIACAIDGKRCFLNIDFANGMTSCIFTCYHFIICRFSCKVSTCRDGVRTNITGVMLSSNGICHDRTVWILFECRLIILNGNMCAQFIKDGALIIIIYQAFEMEKIIIELIQNRITITIGSSNIIRNKLNLLPRQVYFAFLTRNLIILIERIQRLIRKRGKVCLNGISAIFDVVGMLSFISQSVRRTIDCRDNIFIITIHQAIERTGIDQTILDGIDIAVFNVAQVFRSDREFCLRDACRVCEVFGCLAVIELVVLGQSIAERYRRIVVTSDIIGDSPSLIASQSVGAGDVELIAAVAVDAIERCRTKIIRLRAVDRLEERAAFEAEFITRNRVLVDGDITITSDGVVRIGVIGEVNIAEQELIIVGAGISGNTIHMSILAGSICTTVADGILDTRRIKLITVGKALTFCTRLSIDVLILERSIAIGLRCTAVQDNGTTRDFQLAFIRKICNAVAV